MGSAKYVGLDVHKDTISIAVMNSAGKLIMESIIETKAITILQFFQRAARRRVCHLGGRNLGRLVVRPVKTTCDASRGVQSTKECLAAETRQQERPDRCQEIGRAFAPWSAFGGLPRRAWPAHVEGIVPQLFNHQQGSRAGDESAQGVVSGAGPFPVLGRKSMHRAIAPNG